MLIKGGVSLVGTDVKQFKYPSDFEADSNIPVFRERPVPVEDSCLRIFSLINTFLELKEVHKIITC